MCTSMHKWHFHIYMYKDKICWFYRLGRADIGWKLKFVIVVPYRYMYMSMHLICPNSLEHCIGYTGTSINVFFIFVPHFRESVGTLNLIGPSVCLSVPLSVRPSHKNFNLAHIFWSINDRALIFSMPWSLWLALSIDTMPWPWPLTYFKVKVVAVRGTTILRICLWVLTFFQFLKAWRSPYKWNHF